MLSMANPCSMGALAVGCYAERSERGVPREVSAR